MKEKDMLCAVIPALEEELRMYICPHCYHSFGWDIDADYKYCPKCGGKFTGKIKEHRNDKNKINKFIRDNANSGMSEENKKLYLSMFGVEE